MDWNEEPLDDVDPMAVRDAAARRARRDSRPPRAPARRMPQQQGGPQVTGSIVDYGRLAAGAGVAAQAAHLGGMIGQVHDAFRRENESRVAQAREARRMRHEQKMKRMELDAMLARVRQARDY